MQQVPSIDFAEKDQFSIFDFIPEPETKRNGQYKNGEDKHYGPTLEISEEIHASKYRGKDESFRGAMNRIANTLKDDDTHFHVFRDIILNMRFLPAGRVQSAMGSTREVTAFNCFVSRTIEDSMDGIMRAATEAAQTMRMGGGIGYDFSTLRPRGDIIKTLDSPASGPVSFMHVFDAICGTISSAGHRRGAQMGVLRVDHPDIEEFVRAKQNNNKLTNFNISIAVTDEFMKAVENDTDFDLTWNGKTYKTINARNLWEEIMRSTWDYAEPGVLFIDTINNRNNLYYCERIDATNPCSEQTLPPYGACLLGSFNLAKYVKANGVGWYFNWVQFKKDIPPVVRAMDNIIDRTRYPLKQQEQEAKNKRRMGLGITGLANAGEACGFPYGSPMFLQFEEQVYKTLMEECYKTSVNLAKEKGAFPLFDADKYTKNWICTERLDSSIVNQIKRYGIRNSHLLSTAPTGTISLAADNVSSGVEPVFSYSYDRTIRDFDGDRTETVYDYGVKNFGVYGRPSDVLSVDDHINVLTVAYKYTDAAVSKTCNVDPNMPWDEFKDVYIKAWKNGCKGITTFNIGGKRMGILKKKSDEEEQQQGAACTIDPVTGAKSCGE